MSVKIMSVEDHKKGAFYIDVYIDGARFQRFVDLVKAHEYVAETKKKRQAAECNVTLKQIVILPRKEMVYVDNYAM